MTEFRDSDSKQTIERAYSEQRTSLAGFLRRFFDNNQDVEDTLHEVFLKAYQAEKSTKITYPKAFLFKTAKNLSINKREKQEGHRTDNIADFDALSVLDSNSDLAENAATQDRLERALRAIDRLSPRVREVFVLRRIQGYSQREVAQRLGISESTVEKHIAAGVVQITQLADQSPLGRKPAMKYKGKSK